MKKFYNPLRFLNSRHQLINNIKRCTFWSILAAALYSCVSTFHLFRNESPITTSIKDAQTDISFLDGFNPDFYKPLKMLPKGDNGGYLLSSPGVYEMNLQSYCLHAGSYAPSRGDGYISAPLKGQFSDIINNILKRSVEHPEIPQREVQTLIWSVLARTKVTDISSYLYRSALKLLTPEEIIRVNGGAIGLVPEKFKSVVYDKLPKEIRMAIEAEQNLRDAFSNARSTYEDLEKIAVLTGVAPWGKDSRTIPSGRWSYHTDGFFVRYFPDSYSRVKVQISKPHAVKLERDNIGRINKIKDHSGNFLTFEYSEEQPWIPFNTSADFKGFHFKTIIFNKWHAVPPEQGFYLKFQVKNNGWTFQGIPSQKEKPGKNNVQFPNASGRLDSVKTILGEYSGISAHLNIANPLNDLMDISHLKTALENIPVLSDGAWRNDVSALLYQAWQSAYVTWANTNSRDYVPQFPNSGITAVPGNTSRQRLAISGRPADPADPKDDLKKKKEACPIIDEQIREDRILLYVYENQGLLDYAKQHGYNKKMYEEAAGKMAADIYKNGGLNFDFNKLTFGHPADYYKSIFILPGEPPPTGTMMGTKEKTGGIWAEIDGIEVEIIPLNGTISVDNYNKLIKQYMAEYNENPYAAEAILQEVLEHELTHQNQFKNNIYNNNFSSEDPSFHRKFEIEAYKKGIAKLLKAYKDLGC
jgi:hypothetical protein